MHIFLGYILPNFIVPAVAILILHYLHSKKLNSLGLALVKWLQYIDANTRNGGNSTNVGSESRSTSGSTSGPASG